MSEHFVYLLDDPYGVPYKVVAFGRDADTYVLESTRSHDRRIVTADETTPLPLEKRYEFIGEAQP